MPTLSTAIGLMLIALAVALVTRRTRHPYTVALVIWGLILGVLQLFDGLHLTKELILTLLLPPLLFEGGLHIREHILKRRAGIVFGMALGGTLLTALAVAAVSHWLLGFNWLSGLLLGIIVAPTDPVSVLATFRAANVDRELSTIVESESLFNDGIAVVLYGIVLAAIGGAELSPVNALSSFLVFVLGGALVGIVAGALTAWLMRRVDDHLVQVMTTLIAVYGGYLLAENLHVSGVIAVAVSGLIVGNRGLSRTSESSRERITGFWEIIAFLVNSAVFLLIGLELQAGRLLGDLLTAALVFVVLLAVRAILIYGLGAFMHKLRQDLPLSWRRTIHWGGLRGAVPVALALGLPIGMTGRDDLIAITFGVVAFSLLLQGLSMPKLLQWNHDRSSRASATSPPGPAARLSDAPEQERPSSSLEH